ncbi:hypothetical protein O0L34_g4476 [Tuta absoluta]|nr:hypothetical protein O0L34_g4476 [Tuta absoluta]
MMSLLQRVFWILLFLHSIECHLFVPMIPDQCLSQDFCEDVPNYPFEHVDEVIKELAEQGYTFQSDDDVAFVNESMRASPSSNQGEFVDLCPEDVGTIIPQATKDSEGQWRFVINSRTNPPPQLIKFAKCGKKIHNRPCNKVTARGGYTTNCEQDNFDMDILTLDKHGKVHLTRKPIPVCCYCVVYHSLYN